MAKPAAILNPETNKAHLVAQGVLCSLAGVVVAGTVWALGLQPASRARESSPENLPPQGPAPAPAPALAAVTASPVPQTQVPPASFAPSLAPPPPRQMVPPSPSLPTEPRPSLPVGRELRQPIVIDAVEAGRQARRLGDMAASLESLRAADLREPSHPEILGEMALTYEAMGIYTKAAATWRTLRDMGETLAGGYYALARTKLEQRPLSALATPSSPVTLGACQVIKDPTVTKGERISVRVPIIAAPGSVIDPTQMDIHVFLYEKVNGERVEQARSAPPTLNWISAPVDWRDANEELVDVVYELTPPTPEEAKDLGKRTFHGYIVKLFYQNKLVGEQGDPRALLESPAQPGAPAGLDNALFPK